MDFVLSELLFHVNLMEKEHMLDMLKYDITVFWLNKQLILAARWTTSIFKCLAIYCAFLWL